MRPLLLLSLIALAIPAGATEPRTVAEVCGQMPSGQVTACFQTVSGRRVEPLAAGACAALPYSRQIDCLRAVVGRRYGADEIAACEQLPYAGQIDCLAAAGTPVTVEARLPPAAARAVQTALDRLRAGDLAGATALLTRLLAT